MSISLRDVIDTCKVEAIADRMSVSEESEWKYFCRSYSKKFHTPLHLVLEMDVAFVISNVLADQLEDVDVIEKMDELIDMIKTVEDPSYSSAKEKEFEEFAKQSEAEEKERIKNNAPIPDKYTKRKKSESKKELPLSGGINLDYLSKLDKEE